LLESLKPSQDKQLNPAEHPESSAAALAAKYDTHIDNVEEFFKSRTDYVIENILKYIELNEFLDHIVEKNDKDIRY